MTRSPVFIRKAGLAIELLTRTEPRTHASLANERVLNTRTAQSQRSKRHDPVFTIDLTDLGGDTAHEIAQRLKPATHSASRDRIDQNMCNADLLSPADGVDHLVN